MKANTIEIHNSATHAGWKEKGRYQDGKGKGGQGTKVWIFLEIELAKRNQALHIGYC